MVDLDFSAVSAPPYIPEEVWEVMETDSDPTPSSPITLYPWTGHEMAMGEEVVGEEVAMEVGEQQGLEEDQEVAAELDELYGLMAAITTTPATIHINTSTHFLHYSTTNTPSTHTPTPCTPTPMHSCSRT